MAQNSTAQKHGICWLSELAKNPPQSSGMKHFQYKKRESLKACSDEVARISEETERKRDPGRSQENVLFWKARKLNCHNPYITQPSSRGKTLSPCERIQMLLKLCKNNILATVLLNLRLLLSN
ncbi:uncharacterized protein LOC143662519 [Tamandua tetradactyla]|uniref:uncharacterized protein LOC143662519 n=1 Tax=Tamandua tetradactyla TaxID=48850 RepID=UPI004053FA5F